MKNIILDHKNWIINFEKKITKVNNFSEYPELSFELIRRIHLIKDINWCDKDLWKSSEDLRIMSKTLKKICNNLILVLLHSSFKNFSIQVSFLKSIRDYSANILFLNIIYQRVSEEIEIIESFSECFEVKRKLLLLYLPKFLENYLYSMTSDGNVLETILYFFDNYKKLDFCKKDLPKENIKKIKNLLGNLMIYSEDNIGIHEYSDLKLIFHKILSEKEFYEIGFNKTIQ